MEAVKVGKRGTIIVPAKLRKRYGIEEGALVTTEPCGDGVLIRPAVVVPVERYTPERKAEFLLSTATTEKDYRRARKEVKRLGLDPDAVPHRQPE
jgi:AbrB family looped-hinge helix DNA binding protein